MFKCKSYKEIKLLAVSLVVVALAACSSSQAQKAGDFDDSQINDPFEEVNRPVLAFNEGFDRAIADPVVKGYRTVVPEFGRSGVKNFLRNLRSPVNAANQVLQGDVEGFAHDVSRFVINTSIGIGGVFDVAESTGLKYQSEDFGQTLAVWGVDHGPYFVVPFFGPTTARDGFGRLVDSYADPLSHYLSNTDNEEWLYARFGVTYVDTKHSLMDVLADLRRNSFDYYATLRSTYYQHRYAQVRDQGGAIMSAPAIPDYDE